MAFLFAFVLKAPHPLPQYKHWPTALTPEVPLAPNVNHAERRSQVWTEPLSVLLVHYTISKRYNPRGSQAAFSQMVGEFLLMKVWQGSQASFIFLMQCLSSTDKPKFQMNIINYKHKKSFHYQLHWETARELELLNVEQRRLRVAAQEHPIMLHPVQQHCSTSCWHTDGFRASAATTCSTYCVCSTAI